MGPYAQTINSVVHIKLFSLGTSSKVYQPHSLPTIVASVHRDAFPAEEEKRGVQTAMPSNLQKGKKD